MNEIGRRGLAALAMAMVLAAPCPPPALASEPARSGAERTLARIAALAGDWEGTYEWSGARTSKGELKATYSTTGNGSAVVESILMDGITVMTSVYHLDGADLRMTHYCAARNQPRLKALSLAEAAGHVKFGFIDVTNVTSPDQGYVDAVELRLGEEELGITFAFGGGAPRAVERIRLRRARGTQGDPGR
jgi:hypothetical protein